MKRVVLNTTESTMFKSLPLLAALITAGLTPSAWAQKAINNAAALAGGVTPGDTAGYPVTLSEPGHYVLTSALTVPANKPAIVIDAPNVTLDLNGYRIAGPSICSASSKGMVACAPYHTGVGVRVNAVNVQIRNGTLVGFDHGVVSHERGVHLQDLTLSQNRMGAHLTSSWNDGGIRVERVTAMLNGEYGLYVVGPHQLHQVQAINNGAFGMAVNGSGVVFDSLATGNGHTGVHSNGTALRGVRAVDNKLNVAAGAVSMGGNMAGTTPF